MIKFYNSRLFASCKCFLLYILAWNDLYLRFYFKLVKFSHKHVLVTFTIFSLESALPVNINVYVNVTD